MTAPAYVLAFGEDQNNFHCLMGSPDGLTWTVVTPHPAEFTGNNLYHGAQDPIGGLWVSGGNGGIFTSPDAVTWTAVSTPFDPSVVTAVVFAEQIGLWVAGGFLVTAANHLMMTSPDGATWTTLTTPMDGASATGVGALGWNGTLLVAGGTWNDAKVIATSADGATWTERTSPFDSGGWVDTICWDGTTWLAGGYDGAHTHSIMTSPDGITWTARPNPFGSGGSCSGLAVGPTGRVAAAGLGVGSGGHVVATSDDHGATWTGRSSPFDSGTSTGFGFSLVYVPRLNRWILGGEQVDALLPVLAVSHDAVTWTAVSTPFDGAGLGSSSFGNVEIIGFAVAEPRPLIVVVGYSSSHAHTMMASTDAATWTETTNTVFDSPPGPGSGYVYGVAYGTTHADWVEGGSIGFSGGSPPPGIGHSLDAATWTGEASEFDGQSPAQAVWADGLGLWVMGGPTAATVTAIATSVDGVTWISRTTPWDSVAGGYVQIVGWNGSLLVAVGASSDSLHQIMTSPDGITWTQQTTPWNVTGGWVGAIHWDGVTWIAGGYRFDNLKCVLTSPDAVTWTEQSTPFDPGNPGAIQVVWVDGDGVGTVVAAGAPNAPTTAHSAAPVFITSTDHGVTWTGISTGWDTVTGGSPGAVSFGLGEFVKWAPALGLWILGARNFNMSVRLVATSPDLTLINYQTTPWDATALGTGLGGVYAIDVGTGTPPTPTGPVSLSRLALDTALAADDASGDVLTVGGTLLAGRVSTDTALAADLATVATISTTVAVIPRPALAGPGPSQIATAIGAGGIGGGTETVMRITAWDCEVADEGSSKLTFTLAMPPPGKAPTPPTLYFPQLLAQLQQDNTNTATTLPPLTTGGGGGGGTGTVTDFTSLDGTVVIANPTGPTVDLSWPDIDVGTSLIGETMASGAPLFNRFNTTLGWSAMGITVPGAYDTRSGQNNTAIGAGALALVDGGSGNVAVGRSALPNTQAAFSNVGVGVNAGPSTISGSTGDWGNTVCVGLQAQVGAEYAIAIGLAQVDRDGTGSIAIGWGATAYHYPASSPNSGGAIAIGQTASAFYSNDIAIGFGAHTQDLNGAGFTIAIGYRAQAFDVDSISIGNAASCGFSSGGPNPAPQAIAIGYQAACISGDAVAIGTGAYGSGAGGFGGVAIGTNATAEGTSVGVDTVSGPPSVAVGGNATASSGYAIAIGDGANVTADFGIALGYLALVSVGDAVSLGQSYSQVAIGPCTTTQFPTYQGCALFIPNGSGTASGTPTGGGVLFVVSGALHYQGPAGTVTTVAPA